MEQPLVIAGAGIAGLALAAGLQRTETATPYLLADERPELGSSGGAITLWPNAIAALDEIGVGDEVRRAGHPLGAGTITTRGGRVLRSLDLEQSAAALGGPLVAVRRGDLIEILHAQIKPGTVLLGTAVRGYRHDHDRVQVRTDGEPVEASALVGADGYRSEIARTLHPGLPERYAGYPAWRGIADVGGFEPVQMWGAHREFGVVPLGEDASYWFATVREPAGGAVGDEVAHLEAAFSGWPDPVREVLAATDPVSVTRNDVMDRALPRRWTDGPVVVIGDAAHAMRPHLGQGGCQALVDAAVLARLLRQTRSPAAAFTAFESLRRGPVTRVVGLSRAAGRAINVPSGLHQFARLMPDALMLRTLAKVGGTGAFPW
ncbi:FAD-dependent monooxygenase [Nocardioides sp. HM23]|uniref:FAD-dependent monooxygenase n=1 Tax=Nocardioides bizhenqiangii TaxID=3095076 RepID=UPI002ACA58B5|nr:FAD-dependent monooxygenase [Nocardioides sp. HM23]MDZ5622924.1 FAD-dependent monooxygenase [Nocardioides sp. HM23]